MRLIFPFIYTFYLLSNWIFCHRFLGFYDSQSLQICVHLESGQVYWKKTKMLRFIFTFFFLFFISHANVIHREICVKDLSGTIVPRILKFETNIGHDLLYCVKENQPPPIYHSLYLSIFLSLQSNFLSQVSLLLWEPEFFKFCIHLESGQVYCRKEKQDAHIFFVFFFSIFPFLAHLSRRLTRWAYSIPMVRRPSVVRRRRPSSTLSNLNISEVSWPILIRFYV